MGDFHPHGPVLPILAAFSRHDAALDWAERRAVEYWGPIVRASPRYEFVETDYYARSMGTDLKKCFWAFEQLRDPTELVDWKIQTNGWEAEYAAAHNHPERRPLNLDPGYLTLAKLVLASTKDHAHRIYLDRGIFAEVTLYFQEGQWRWREWTFPDYRRADYHEFLTDAREWLRGRKADGGRGINER